MPIMRVSMLRDMNSKRHDHDRYVVSKVVGVYIARVTCPPI